MVSIWGHARREAETTPHPSLKVLRVSANTGGESSLQGGVQCSAYTIRVHPVHPHLSAVATPTVRPSCACSRAIGRAAQNLRRGRGGFSLGRCKKIGTTPTPPYGNDGAIRRSGGETRCGERDPMQTVSPPARARAAQNLRRGRGGFRLDRCKKFETTPSPPYWNDGAIRRSGGETRCKKSDPSKLYPLLRVRCPDASGRARIKEG